MSAEVSGDPMPEDIVKAFYPGETPLTVMENLSEQRGGSETKKKMIVVSSQRLLYFEENATSLFDVTTFAFARIDSVTSHSGKKTSEVKITDTDGAITKITWLENDEAEKILLTLQSAMNSIGTAEVLLEKKKPMFSGEEWTLKKPVDYLTKTVRAETSPMTESYVAPIMPKDDEEITEDDNQSLFEESESVIKAPSAELDQETILECLKALKLLYESCVITDEMYRSLRLPLLEKLDL